MKGLISIIIPVYNVEKYLSECLQSVIDQTYKELEIIIVNDNSPDNSSKIINEFAKKDKRIIVINQQTNGGYGKAINTGFKRATGEFIGIVESDDFIAKNMYETLYKASLKTNAEIIKSNYYHYKTKKGTPATLLKSSLQHLEKILIPNRSFNSLFPKGASFIEFKEANKAVLFDSTPAIWSGIYRAEFIKNNSLFILETAGASYQDLQFLFETMFLASKIYLIPEKLYFYRTDNINSSVHSKDKGLLIFNIFYVTYNSLQKRNLEKLLLLNDRIFYGFLGNFYWNFYKISNKNRYLFLLEWQKALIFMMEKDFNITGLSHGEQKDIHCIIHNLKLAYIRLWIRYIFAPMSAKLHFKYAPQILYFVLFRMLKRAYKFSKQ